jgi:ABC-2 type transport system permease protein
LNAPDEKPPLLAAPTPSLDDGRLADKALRRLFLTLFLRGRTSRGLRKQTAPKSVGSKLALALCFYALFGAIWAVSLRGQPVFTLSFYLHSMTLAFLGMFVASSSGEVLFNKEEGDILLHRPVTPRALLWAKIGVLVQVSLWLGGAFNLAGFFMGVWAGNGGWLFPLAHAASTALEALFCAGVVVMGYQLCLRWFGRERLDGLMTTAQVLFAIVFILGTQVAPQMIGRFHGRLALQSDTWWINLLPSAWFAGLDDALAGSRQWSSWALGGLALAATAAVLWLAFAKLARYYEAGLQRLGDAPSLRPSQKTRRRWLDAVVNAPPLS